MGYTHYFTPKKKTQLNKSYDEAWDEFVEDVKTLHKALPENLVIKGWDGTGDPTFGEEVISFNGDGSKGLDHETLYIEKGDLEWSFCKTNHKPYDLFVMAVLLAAQYHLGFVLSSDGTYEDWKDGMVFFIETLFDDDFTNVNNYIPKNFLD